MEQKRSFLVVLLVACAAYLLQPTSQPFAQDLEPARKSCITAKCHATMGKANFVHGPMAVGECLTCHVQKGEHSFEPIASVGEQCTECHQNLDTMKAVHAPVKKGECTKCHDPHESPFKFQLRAEGADLCLSCHDKAIMGGKYLHGPVGVGACNACHSVHQSEFAHLLTADGNDVCYGCHADAAATFKGNKFMHAPVEESCTNCHNPHSSDFRFTLSAEGSQDLCYSCHSDKQKEVAQVTVPHKGLETDRKCLACHNPHATSFPKQLEQEPMDLCLSCHDREYNGQNGRIGNMQSLLSKEKVHHGPIKQKDCSGCHNTHGSKNFRILREGYPQLFYAPYAANNYKLCFMCHQRTIASEEQTLTLTNFRNGEQNLHFVHVNKSVKGRTCRACHDAHATNNPKHVRNAVPFAKWNLPVGFKKTETGGTCLPGCHQMFGYDRKAPVVNKPAAKQ